MRAGGLVAAVGFFRRAADFFGAGARLRAAAFVFGAGRLPAFFPLAFAAERREADFFFAAMVPLVKLVTKSIRPVGTNKVRDAGGGAV